MIPLKEGRGKQIIMYALLGVCLFCIIFSWVSRLGVQPIHYPRINFVYATDVDKLNCNKLFSIDDGVLVKHNDIYPKGYAPIGDADLFLHDVSINQSYPISLEEVQALTLDPNIKSPDGFEIVHAAKIDGIIPFFVYTEKNYKTYVLKGNRYRRKLFLKLHSRYYCQNFHFIGWVVGE